MARRDSSTSQPAAPVLVEAPVGIAAASAKHLVLNMTGASIVTSAKDWPKFQKEWHDNFAEYAKADGVTFEVQDGEGHATVSPEHCSRCTSMTTDLSALARESCSA